MRRILIVAIVTAGLASAAFWAQGRGQRGQQAPSATAPPAAGATTPAPAAADPYLNNAAPGTTSFPLAAPAGKDSNAINTAPNGAQNQGAFDPGNWKYGTAFNAPAGSKIWNPVKLKMTQGGKVTGGTLFNTTDPAIYCSMANAGYDFIWTEMPHDRHA